MLLTDLQQVHAYTHTVELAKWVMIVNDSSIGNDR